MELVQSKYKQTEVGLIPEDWSVKKIVEISNPVRGGSPRPAGSPKYFNGDYIPWLTVASLTNISDSQIYVNRTNSYLTEAGSHLSRILDVETLIIANSGATLGVAKLLGIKCCANDGVAALQDIEKAISSKYLVYFINSITKKLREDIATGNGQPNLNTELIGNISIPIPSTLNEQKAITTALSDLDDLITNLEKLISKKKAIKQGAMQQLLKGKLRLKGFDSNEGYKDSELGLIPSDWDVKPLPEVFDYIHGKAHEQFIDKSGNYKVVNSKYISSEGKVVKYSKQNFCPARQGDILTVLSDLPNGKALAKTFYVEEDNVHAVNQRVCIWRSKKDDSLFLNYVMNRHKYFLKFDDGVTQTHILNHHIEKCPVLVPRNIEEQKAIGICLRDMQKELESLEIKKAKYQDMKQGMMQELLTGKTRLV